MNIPRLIYLCFAVYFIWNFKQQRERNAFWEVVYEQDLMVVEMLEERIDEMWDKSARELNDYRKKDYRPILPAFAEIQSSFNKFSKKIDSLSKLQPSNDSKVSNFQIQESFRQTIEKGYHSYEQLLLNHGESPFGFKQDEIESRLENMRIYLENHLPKDNFNYPSSNLLSHLKSRAKMLEHHLLKEIVSYKGGRMIICRFGQPIEFPVITPKKINPVLGESFEATIGLGQYIEEIDPVLVEYVLNGDTLVADPITGLVNISIPATSYGMKQLDISYSIINPLTGHVIKAEVPFRYRVFPN